MLNKEKISLDLALKSGNKERIEKVFESIYYNYSKLVSFCIGKYIADEETIKDLTNDVFLSFFKHITNISNIKSYLCTSAKNKALDYLQKEKNVFIVEDIDSLRETINFTSTTFYSSLIEDLESILSKEELDIVELHALYGYSFKEIGIKKNISSNYATVIYFRALKKFKNSEKGKIYEKR
ncbi:MAG: RNA polymerase sigma factor [Bacilli bacterium]